MASYRTAWWYAAGAGMVVAASTVDTGEAIGRRARELVEAGRGLRLRRNDVELIMEAAWWTHDGVRSAGSFEDEALT